MSEREEFKREERFIVIKRKHLTKSNEEYLRNELRRLHVDTVECVVVEADWPEYETIWKMIEARVTGASQPALAQGDEKLLEALRKIRDHDIVMMWNRCVDCDYPKQCSASTGCRSMKYSEVGEIAEAALSAQREQPTPVTVRNGIPYQFPHGTLLRVDDRQITGEGGSAEQPQGVVVLMYERVSSCIERIESMVVSYKRTAEDYEYRSCYGEIIGAIANVEIAIAELRALLGQREG